MSAVVPREVTQGKLDRRNAVAAKFLASSSFTLADLIGSGVHAHPGRALLHYGARAWSYAEVNTKANRWAHALHALGVRRGEVVALALENRPEFVFAWFALAKLGVVAAFLNTQIGGRALAHALEVTGAQRAIVGEECLPAFDTPEMAERIGNGMDASHFERGVVGVDIAKRVFQLYWVEMQSGQIKSLQLRRAKFLEHFANRVSCLIGMEACGGSQHWARELQNLGHEVKLLPARMVKAFVGGNKNDVADAHAIWTAVQQPGIKAVAIKSEGQ